MGHPATGARTAELEENMTALSTFTVYGLEAVTVPKQETLYNSATTRRLTEAVQGRGDDH